ncbi:hypothetical protein [Aestuariirhabdus litorea]|uniref:hypothetical protein n=1 Tax=Aestuariirhabdus litorea TaxID=2528527 RepID=UPI000F61F061|nr:hypothetical protein [Aestuariirhabdus litorea]RWW92796.1 hypothetical protein DZC74_12265 [Endozoicomonadaceae bacterium GTF-13]
MLPKVKALLKHRWITKHELDYYQSQPAISGRACYWLPTLLLDYNPASRPVDQDEFEGPLSAHQGVVLPLSAL